MAFVPATNVLQVEIRGSLNGIPVECIQYHEHTGAIVLADADDLFDWYEAEFLPDYLAPLGIEYKVNELYGTDLTSNTSPTYSRVFSPQLEGGEASAALPGNVAACISFRTIGRGRSARGRNYVPGILESDVSGNGMDVGLVNALVAAFELMLGGGTYPANWAWVIVSRYLLGSPRVAALVSDVIDVLSTNLTVESQRGRLK